MYFFVAFMCFLHHIVLYVAANVREFGGKRQYTWRQMSGSLGANVKTLGGKCQGVWGQTSVHLGRFWYIYYSLSKISFSQKKLLNLTRFFTFMSSVCVAGIKRCVILIVGVSPKFCAYMVSLESGRQ